MRYRDILSEVARSKPSAELLAKIRAWADNTTKDRVQKENALLALRAEATRFLRPSYARFYRGQPLDTTQLVTLRGGQPITIDLPRLSSWTTARRIAEDYAEFGDTEIGAVLAIPGTMLIPIIDLNVIMTFFTFDDIRAALAQNDDTLHDMSREREVIVYHEGGLRVEPRFVAAIYEPESNDSGRVVRRTLRQSRSGTAT